MSNAGKKVVITQKFFDEQAIAYLEDHGYVVEIAQLPPGIPETKLAESELRDLLEGASGWIVGHARVTRSLMSALPDLAIISRRGVGYEQVDTRAAQELGKVVTIAAGGNDASVADQVVGMMISLGRRFQEAQQAMNNDDWNILVGTELFQKTVGIVGFGRIGRSLARRLRGFDVEILVHSPRLSPQDVAEFDLAEATFEELVERSDYISVHAPLNDDTHHLFDAAVFAKMKPGAVLINTARGGLVSDAALLDALLSRTIAGAGLDVFESESDIKLKPITNELIALPNVVAAPHAGASTHEALQRTNLIAARCVVDVLEGRMPPPRCVVADGRLKDTHGPNNRGVADE